MTTEKQKEFDIKIKCINAFLDSNKYDAIMIGT